MNGFATLLKAAWRGDEASFRRLVEGTRETLFWTVKRMIGRDGIAEEILQDAYLALWKGTGASDVRNPEAWLRRFVVNRALDHLRREENKRPHLVAEDTGLEASSTFDPEVALGTAESEEVLQHALQKLPPKMRFCIVLRAEGYGYAEIASQLGVSESTVRNHVRQARLRLHGDLGEMGNE